MVLLRPQWYPKTYLANAFRSCPSIVANAPGLAAPSIRSIAASQRLQNFDKHQPFFLSGHHYTFFTTTCFDAIGLNLPLERHEFPRFFDTLALHTMPA